MDWKEVEEIFLQGDVRYDCIDSEFIAKLLNSTALTLEKIDLKRNSNDRYN